MALPTFVAEGTNNTGTAGVIGGMPAGATTGDILIYHIESYGNDAKPTVTTGWTEVATANLAAASIDDPRITVWWAPYSAGIDRNVADTGDHTNVRILAFRGCDTTTPIHVFSTDTESVITTTHSHVGPTTTVADCLVVMACAIGDDSSTAPTSVANATLASLASRDTYSAVASGNDGARFAYSGQKATAGATGTWTFALSVQEKSAAVIYALQPPAGVTVTPAVVAAVAAVPAPTVKAAATVTPAAVAAVAAVPTPTILTSTPATVTPAAVAAVGGVPGPTAKAASTVTPAVVPAPTTVPAPTLLAASKVTPTVVAVVAAVPTPSVLAASTVTPAVVPAVSTVPTPTINTDTAVTPAAVAAVTTVPTPAVLAGSVVTPAVVAATTTVSTPTILVDASAVVTPAVVPAVTTVPAPTVVVPATRTPAAVPAVTAVPTPTILAGSVVTPATVVAISTVPTPTVTGQARVTPTVVPLVTTVPTPTITLPGAVSPATVAAVAAVPAPVSVRGAALVTPNTVAAFVTVAGVTIFTGLIVITARNPVQFFWNNATFELALVPLGRSQRRGFVVDSPTLEAVSDPFIINTRDETQVMAAMAGPYATWRTGPGASLKSAIHTQLQSIGYRGVSGQNLI